MSNWDHVTIEAEKVLDQLQLPFACVIGSLWDTKEEYEALRLCYGRYNPTLLKQIDRQKVLMTVSMFQILPFPTLEEALQFCRETPCKSPRVSVWDHGEKVEENL